MVDVDRILELKRRIMQIADEVDKLGEDNPEDRETLEEAYRCLDQADDLLGELT